ncbi:uncharacterized protein LOC103102835 isoform X1 [Monodelphis domestica]|uniref:uncharacterized protein LOC103102835 isoform X1 n=1 Tax=Monodelphis domestica TaxID=13616 RepID=UPI0024E2428A|nr:uncharacterized protein LOC103102835 isoform X1 [Monodelphis domestica]XP_056677785.1 uncharacterized protein LOC103102835 isoform X1 [Monodelphis domestica]XP_056677786.1 uncharacterized protein LOC103102835 isoform X1 [Monodelphis domestica]
MCFSICDCGGAWGDWGIPPWAFSASPKPLPTPAAGGRTLLLPSISEPASLLACLSLPTAVPDLAVLRTREESSALGWGFSRPSRRAQFARLGGLSLPLEIRAGGPFFGPGPGSQARLPRPLAGSGAERKDKGTGVHFGAMTQQAFLLGLLPPCLVVLLSPGWVPPPSRPAALEFYFQVPRACPGRFGWVGGRVRAGADWPGRLLNGRPELAFPVLSLSLLLQLRVLEQEVASLRGLSTPGLALVRMLRNSGLTRIPGTQRSRRNQPGVRVSAQGPPDLTLPSRHVLDYWILSAPPSYPLYPNFWVGPTEAGSKGGLATGSPRSRPAFSFMVPALGSPLPIPCTKVTSPGGEPQVLPHPPASLSRT